MPLKVAVQMDHVSTVNIAGDTSFALSLEAQRRGHKLFHYTPDRLSLLDGKVYARIEEMEVRDEKGNHFTLGAPVRTDLAEMDVILLRQDPPFDMNYITTTHLLERIHPKTLVVNDPAWVRNSPEKIFVTEFPDLMPDTLITKDLAEVSAFRKQHGDIIVKPLYGNGGAGIFHLNEGDRNLASLLEMFSQMFREPFIVQRYLKDVRKGDKRIILIDGEVAGAINRVPAESESRSNMHVGGRAEKTELTEREREICARIGPSLKQRGFILVGIDVIGDYMTEINVTSPTGIREVKRFGGADIAGLFWGAVEAKRATLNRARQVMADFLKGTGLKINKKLDLTGDAQRIPMGWVFHYNSSAFARSGQISDSLAGQGPTIVLDDGRLLEGGSAETVSDILLRYGVKSV